MQPIVLSGSGLFTPPHSISNDELVECFNAYVERFNQQNAAAIADETVAALAPSNSDFIVKASGIEQRHVMDKDGILDIARMAPNLPERGNEELSILAEMGVKAAQGALDQAGLEAAEIDAVIVACSNLQRAYPAIAIEVQRALGCGGFGFDMNVACSSATFGINMAADMVRSGSASRVLVVNPEICSGHLNFRDRDSHFIFGDVATAVIVEAKQTAKPDSCWEILGTKLATQFSNNIRNNFGFLNRAAPEGIGAKDKLFVQEGRKVFKDVVPWVSETILSHLNELSLDPTALKRLWLHQANKSMNDFIGRKVMGRAPSFEEQPNVLQDYANTSSAGSIIAFHKYNQDLSQGDIGLICSFGAGYSAGSIVLQKTA